jgi:hypothetical protein
MLSENREGNYDFIPVEKFMMIHLIVFFCTLIFKLFNKFALNICVTEGEHTCRYTMQMGLGSDVERPLC